MVVTEGTTIFQAFRGQVFLNLFYIRLPSNVEYFTVTHLNQAHV